MAVELVHLASLYHDDVMDEATVRRNVESVNARFGNLVAIVAGDFLLARSAEIAAGLGTEIAALLAATLGELCRGQVAEVHAAFRVDRSTDNYTGAIAGKTAALMATSCRIGALTGGLPRHEVELFTEFGRHFGMAFQIRDDILDVIGHRYRVGEAGRPGRGRRDLHPSGAAGADRPGGRSGTQTAARPASRLSRTGQGPLDRGRFGAVGRRAGHRRPGLRRHGCYRRPLRALVRLCFRPGRSGPALVDDLPG